MRIISIAIPAFLTFSLLFLLPGCNRHINWEKESSALLQQATDLDQRHAQLNSRIDSLWDITSALLEESIPSDFPAIDRNIFIKARNADHIRMFMSFQKLDPEVQSLVNKAGIYDQMLAARMSTLMSEQEEFESKKIQFLREVREDDAAKGRQYADQFRLAVTTK